MDWSKPPQISPPRSSLVDRGFELLYFRLSNRRRFWRTVYTLPFLIPCLFLIDFAPKVALPAPEWLLDALIVLAAAIQLGWTYVKWQEDKRNGVVFDR